MNPELLTITNITIAITCAISLFLMHDEKGKSQLVFHPVTIRKDKEWFRFLSSGFIHADFWHLAINMLVLWSFGTAVETHLYPAFLGEYSSYQFAALYFGGIIVSSIPSYTRHKTNNHYAALGASGGVAAVVFAAIVFAPWQNLYLYGILPIPQIIAGVSYLVYSWYKDKNATDNIGHMAHLTGAIWGFCFTIVMNFDLLGHFLRKTFAGPF